MRKETSLRRGLEIVKEKIRTQTEADLNARSDFKKTQKPLEEALETTHKRVNQVRFLSPIGLTVISIIQWHSKPCLEIVFLSLIVG